MALPKKNRLSLKRDVDNVFKRGRTVKGSFLFIRFLGGWEGKYSRFAFIIPSKHVPLAVDRNKIKRMFSEEVKKVPLLVKWGYDIIVVVHKKIGRERFKELGEELRATLQWLKTQSTNKGPVFAKASAGRQKHRYHKTQIKHKSSLI